MNFLAAADERRLTLHTEPAPQELSTPSHSLANPRSVAPVGAAPLPEEALMMVNRLKVGGMQKPENDRCIDLLERMTEQVAALTHDVLTATEERDQKDKELAALTQELSDASRDAKRYRWLRDTAYHHTGDIDGIMTWCVRGIDALQATPIAGDELDAAIDSAMLKTPNVELTGAARHERE